MANANGNLISHDPIVSVIFDAVARINANHLEKLQGIIRAGKIAEAYLSSRGSIYIIQPALGDEETFVPASVSEKHRRSGVEPS